MFEIELIIYIKMDLALNNLQKLICHKTHPTNQLTNLFFSVFFGFLSPRHLLSLLFFPYFFYCLYLLTRPSYIPIFFQIFLTLSYLFLFLFLFLSPSSFYLLRFISFSFFFLFVSSFSLTYLFFSLSTVSSSFQTFSCNFIICWNPFFLFRFWIFSWNTDKIYWSNN